MIEMQVLQYYWSCWYMTLPPCSQNSVCWADLFCNCVQKFQLNGVLV